MKSNLQQNQILTGKIVPILFQISIPILICSFFQQLSLMTDLIIVGKTLGTDAIAIIGGSASMFIALFSSLVSGIVSGCIVITGQLYGQNEQSKIKQGVHTSFSLAFFLSLVYFLIMFVSAPALFRLLRVPEILMVDSLSYLRFYSVSFIPYFLFQMSVNLMRSFGQTKTPSFLLIFSFLLNILFDYLFIVGLRLGLSGVALSYILTQTLVGFLAMRSVYQRFDLTPKFIIHSDLLWAMLKIGIPASFTSILFALTNLLVQRNVNLLEPSMISGYAINAKIENFYWITIAGLGFAVSTFASQNYGAQNNDRIIKGTQHAMKIAVVITVTISAIIYFFRFELVRMFTDDPVTIVSAAKIIQFMAPLYLAYSAIDIYGGTLKGIGKFIIPTVITFLTCLIRTLWLLITASLKSYQTILMCFPISWVLTTVLIYLYYHFEIKK